jgi:hypothetical protein
MNEFFKLDIGREKSCTEHIIQKECNCFYNTRAAAAAAEPQLSIVANVQYLSTFKNSRSSNQIIIIENKTLKTKITNDRQPSVYASL